MISSMCPHARKRFAAFLLLAALVFALAIFSCSQDEPNALGSDSDLIGSEPGDVFQDTLRVLGDKVVAMKTPIAVEQELVLGLDSLYTISMILQPSFAGLTDQMKKAPVTKAELRIPPVLKLNDPGDFPARFYGYDQKYAQGDTVNISSLSDALVDPVTGSIDRTIKFSDAFHALDTTLVRTWIHEEDTREAIVVECTNTVDERTARFVAVENTDPGAALYVTFGSPVNDEVRFSVTSDATIYTPRYTTTNLIVSDGYPRRVYFRAELDSVAKDASVHTAKIRFYVVPGSVVGRTSDRRQPSSTVDGVDLILYIPDSTDVASPSFKTGQRITDQLALAGADYVDFPLTNAIFLIKQEKLNDNGFAIRMRDENTKPRQIEFYGTDAPVDLRPQVYITTSTPAVFH